MIINYKITKSNKLILSKSCLSLNNYRWLNIFFSKINSKKNILEKVYSASFIDFKNFYPFIKESSLKLYALSFKKNIKNMSSLLLYKEKKGYQVVNFVESIKYEKDNLYIKFFKTMKNHLVNQEKQFTSYFIKNIVNFKSQYSFRVYEIAIMYLNQGLKTKKLDINLFKEQIGLGLSKYNRFNNLIKKLQNNIQEINDYSDIKIILNFDRKKYNQDISNLEMNISYKSIKNIISINPLLKQKVINI